MAEQLRCPVCTEYLHLNYEWLHGCETEDCEMNGLILMVQNDEKHKEAFQRVSEWIRVGRAELRPTGVE